MLATDKQINCLFALQNKVNKIADIFPESGVKKFHYDWRHERSMGMTVSDASIRIDAFHSIIQGVNIKRMLFGLNQF